MLVCPEREWPDAEVSSQVTEGIGLSLPLCTDAADRKRLMTTAFAGSSVISYNATADLDILFLFSVYKIFENLYKWTAALLCENPQN
ncbi:hypothetical protein T01_15293 [Trichinella spiralis]|uniref:Uncharacterized protein n=1 Tax=Trichinella spiralis TaxID=6334 RepID=A0A0V1BHW9_TRISP|nr:hypothetical protein T01_15293 [Trichinella spiralis]